MSRCAPLRPRTARSPHHALLLRGAWLLVLLGLAGAGRAAAQQRQDPLLWIDTQVGVLVQLHEPAPALRRFFQGPLGKRVARVPAVRRWWARQQNSFRAVVQQVARQLGFSPQELERVALRRRLVLALWPPDLPGEDGKLLVLIDCGEDQQALRLERGLRRLFQPEPDRWQRKQENRLLYWLHQEPRNGGSGETTIVGTLGSFVAVSNDLQVYRRVLLRYTKPMERADSLAAMPSFQEALAARLPETWLWGFVNLPAWEPTISRERQLQHREGDSGQEQLLRIWPALRYLAFGVRTGEHLLGYAQLAYRRNRLPRELILRLQALEGTAGGFAHLPRNSAAAATLHLDLYRLLQIVFQESGRRPGSAAAVTDPDQDHERPVPLPVQAGLLALVSLLQPSQTVALIAFRDEKDVLRLGWVVAVALKRRWPHAQAALAPEQAVAEVLPGVASMLGSLVLERKVVYQAAAAGDHTIFRPLLSPGAKPLPPEEPLPAFATAGGHLWAASSAGALRYCWRETRRASLADHSCWPLLQEAVPEPHHRFFVSLAELRRLLQRRPMAVPELLEPEKEQDPDRVARAAEHVAQFMAVADYVAAAVQVGPREIRFALVVMVQDPGRAAEPAR